MRKEFMIAMIPALTAMSALAFTVLGNLWCETVTFPPIQTVDVADTPEMKFGPFYQQKLIKEERTLPGGSYVVYREACVAYPEGTKKDPKWKTVMAFTAITIIIGGLTIFYAVFAPCLYFQADLWKAGGFLFIFCCITQGLTLLFLESNICKNNQFLSKALYESKCEWDWGFKLNITSVVFWFLAGVLMIGVIPSPVRPERPPAETQTVTYSQGKQPDGTTVVAETNVVKGTYVPGTGIVEEQPSQV